MSAKVRAGMTAVLLLLTGLVLGIGIDRHVLLARDRPEPLTVDGLIESLELPPDAATHVRALFDTIHADLVAAARVGPDSMAAAAEQAHDRIEEALPPESRNGFHEWLRAHHRLLMEQLEKIL